MYYAWIRSYVLLLKTVVFSYRACAEVLGKWIIARAIELFKKYFKKVYVTAYISEFFLFLTVEKDVMMQQRV